MNSHLLIYNYVFINLISDTVLLYNSVNGKSVISTNPIFINLLKHKNIENDYVIPLNETVLANQELNSIFEELEEYCFGQIIKSEFAPLNFKPILDIDGYNPDIFNENINSLNEDELKNRIFTEVVGKNIMSNFFEVTIHFNISNESLSPFSKGHKQYPFPIIGKYEEIDVALVEKFFKQEMPNLNRVNIIVGNINEDNIERLNILIEFFHKKGKIFLYTLYNNCDKIQDLTLNDSIVYLWILPNDIESDNIINGYNLLGVATNQSDFDKYTQKSDLLLECYPLHTGNNNQFCKELMSFDKKDILSLHLSEKEIFANQNINSNLFGEITIVPNGSIYSCINKDPIGSFYSDELKDILFNEFLKFKNWFFTRNKINKCNKCIFNFLCPPVTNFEMCLNDMSFCD